MSQGIGRRATSRERAGATRHRPDDGLPHSRIPQCVGDHGDHLLAQRLSHFALLAAAGHGGDLGRRSGRGRRGKNRGRARETGDGCGRRVAVDAGTGSQRPRHGGDSLSSRQDRGRGETAAANRHREGNRDARNRIAGSIGHLDGNRLQQQLSHHPDLMIPREQGNGRGFGRAGVVLASAHDHRGGGNPPCA